jgi:N-ethylmaleimide reductase
MLTDAVGMVDLDEPRALTLSEIPGVIAEYRQGALKARAAGFEGAELHAAAGYLPTKRPLHLTVSIYLSRMLAV